MTMIKHSQRSLRTPCKRCGATGLYWYHDTTNDHLTKWCKDGSDACKQASLTGNQANWTIGDAHGIPHYCGTVAASRLSDWQSRQTAAQHSQHIESITAASVEISQEITQLAQTSITRQLQSHDIQIPGNGSAAETLVTAIQALAGNSLNEAAIRQIAVDAIADEKQSLLAEIRDRIESVSMPTRIELFDKATGETRLIEGAVHKMFPTLLTITRSGVQAWLTGPAGSGKTKMAEQVAEAMSLDFGFISLTVTKPISDILGYRDAVGIYQSTSFRRIFEDGGLFLFDECDNGNPNTLGCVNAALANGHMEFPDRMVARHPDCYIMAAANTYGTGPDSQYVGRMQLDAAFLNRFGARVQVDYDNALEDQLAASAGAEPTVTAQWVSRVRQIRDAALALHLPLVISPRNTVAGCRLLAAGMGWDAVQQLCLREGISDQDWSRLNGTGY